MHPTAIRETLRALRLKFAGQKVWAIFEPRSNTTRRNVFQHELALSFADADAVVVAQVAKLDQLKAEERLNPRQFDEGHPIARQTNRYLADVDAIVEHLGRNAQGGDVVCVFSNAASRHHGKLLERLKSRRRGTSAPHGHHDFQVCRPARQRNWCLLRSPNPETARGQSQSRLTVETESEEPARAAGGQRGRIVASIGARATVRSSHGRLRPASPGGQSPVDAMR